jgi:hypothetical protein
LGLVAAAAGDRPDNGDWDTHRPADEVIAVLAGRLHSRGQSMLKGDYSRVPAIRDLIRTQASDLRW